jgi:alpha-amylase
MDDDLGDSDAASLGYGGKVIPGTYRSGGGIWPAAGTRVNLSVYADAPQQVDLQVVLAGATPVLRQSGSCTANVPLAASFMVAAEGRHIVQAKLSGAAAAAARIYIKVDYQGPATSTLF